MENSPKINLSEQEREARYIFESFKAFLAVWVLLRAFWVLLAAFWLLWTPFFVLLAACGCLLGASWSLLGASWGLLGASWGLLGRSSNLSPNLVRFWLPKGCPKGAKREPKWHQNGTQNGSKSKTNFDIEKKHLQDRLGVVLGRSLVIFGRPGGSF